MDEPIRHPLAYARWLHGWSQAELARRVKEAARRRDRRAGTSRQRVSLWEKSVTPDEFSQELLSDIFDVPHEHVTALGWPHWLPGHETPAPLGAGLTVTVLRKAAQMAVDRRTFLTYTPAALGALALQWATIDPALAASSTSGRPVDPALVDWLENSAHDLTSLPTAHRQHTGALLDGHLTTVVDLLERGSYGHAVGIRLHSLAAALSQTLAWHRFDYEHHAAANRYWHAAVHAAHQAGDTDMGAGALSDIAYQSIWLGHPRAAADSLEHALSRTTNPTARSLLFLRKARAHAMLHEARACYRDLAQAEKLLDSTTESAPEWCSWMSYADLAVDTGRCLIDLGQPARAHDQISQGITLLPTARDKTKAVFLAYEAESLLAQGDISQAAQLARQSLGLAQQIGASRCVQQIRDLSATFDPLSSEQGVDRLLYDVALTS
ncbi:helix-turn-helix transcriptional regulator [Streptomyces sp. IBSNAI002]|uniref:helix-turn-helix transcriptional regulator n=1 Tax=Streptomyces sp. IBSNAI002 TaxID=3457500 RepID=UPI003FD3E3C9